MALDTLKMDPLLLYLPSRVLTTLYKNDLHRIEALADHSRSELLDLSQVGHQSANEIIGLLMDLNIPAGTSLAEVPLYTEAEAKLLQRLAGKNNKLWKTRGVDTFRRGSLRSGTVDADGLNCTFKSDDGEITVAVAGENSPIDCSCGPDNCKKHALAGLLLAVERRRRSALPDQYAPPGDAPFQPLTHDPLFRGLKPATRQSILEQGILWVEELAPLSVRQIKEIAGIGPSRFAEIKHLLDEVNLEPGTAPPSASERPAARFPPSFGRELKRLRRTVSRPEQGEKLFRDGQVGAIEQNSGGHYTGRVDSGDQHTVSLDWKKQEYECSCRARTSRNYCRHQLAVALEAAKGTRLRVLSGMETEGVSDELASLIGALDGAQPPAGLSGDVRAEADRSGPLRYYLYQTESDWILYPSNTKPDNMPPCRPREMDEPAYDDLEDLAAQKDRAILKLLSSRSGAADLRENSTEWGELLPLLSERNLFIQDNDGTFVEANTVQERGRAGVELRPADEAGYRMKPFVQLDDRRLFGDAVELLSVRPLWIRADERLWSVASSPVFAELLNRREGKGIPIREADQTTYAEQVLPKLMDHGIRVVIPEGRTIEHQPEPAGRVYLSEAVDELLVKPRFHYGSVEFGRVTAGTFLLPDPEEDGVWKAERNVEKERDILQVLEATGLTEKTGGAGLTMTPETGRARWLIEERPRLEERGIEVITRGNLDPAPKVSEPASSRLSVRGGLDWFELEGQLEYEERTAELKEIFAALQNNQKYVRLSNSTYGKIPEAVANQLSGVNDLARSGENKVQLPGLSTGTLAGLLDSIDNSKTDETFEKYRRFYREFDGIEAVREPASFQGTLRPYQRAGLAWLGFLRKYGFGGLLADDMGLGKTVQVLAHLQLVDDRLEQFPDTLVICPRSVLKNWKREANRFLSDPNLHEHHGPNRLQVADEWPDQHLSLTTYGTMRSDINMLKTHQFDTIVLDESQAIRNPDTKTARAVRLLDGEHRIGLSGTPVQNKALDLWSQFQFLNPGLLGDRPYFEETFVRPIEKERDDEASARLQRLIHPFLLRRTKDRVEKQLPELSRSTLDCPLFPEQKELYETYRRRFRKEISDTIRQQGVQQSRFKVLEGLTRLRQICCHPGLVDAENYGPDSSNKLARFLEQATELIEEGHRALVFSQFVQFLDRIREAVEGKEWSCEYLDGSTRNREERVRRFQSDESIPLFLISLKAGGEGLNLTGADYVFLMDPWWNPAVEQQAMDRTHRIGQDQPVFVYRFICPGTIEEKMLRLQERKKEVAGDVVTPEAGVFKDMERDELLDLFA